VDTPCITRRGKEHHYGTQKECLHQNSRTGDQPTKHTCQHQKHMALSVTRHEVILWL
jgi:hypothetical protein